MNILLCNFLTTDIGAEHGDVRPLDVAHMCTLIVNGVRLLNLIDSNDAFLNELVYPTVGSITRPQHDHLVNIEQRRDRNDRLLEFLTRRSVANFNQFIKVLSKYQAHIVPLLDTDGGQLFYMYHYRAFSHQSLSAVWMCGILVSTL